MDPPGQACGSVVSSASIGVVGFRSFPALGSLALPALMAMSVAAMAADNGVLMYLPGNLRIE